ncbi:MAG: ABC transporter ATP-binding protein [Planctomycetes bacterium]|nr:ABC transporter ATP-binding protein [Planctomycetota bacterium]
MLILRDLRRSFGSLQAVDGVSLHVDRAEVVGLLGPNGAGKSTTVAMATGLLRPDSGEVEIVGFGEPMRASARRHVGLAPQELALYEGLTAVETLVFFARLYGASVHRDAIQAGLEEVGLASRGKDRVGTFSGGMKRRLNLAVALIHKPSVLVLDEPTAGVDPQSRAHVREIIRQRAGAGCAVLVTTHDMEEAEKICDRIAVMDQGKIRAHGTLSQLVTAHGSVQGTNARGLEEVLLNLTGRSLRE